MDFKEKFTKIFIFLCLLGVWDLRAQT
ncbi:uncharacterized protein METZ01_LOCUS91180, partial [marine metagenome]